MFCVPRCNLYQEHKREITRTKQTTVPPRHPCPTIWYWRQIVCYSKIFNYSFNFTLRPKLKNTYKAYWGWLTEVVTIYNDMCMAVTAALLQYRTVLYRTVWDCLFLRNRLMVVCTGQTQKYTYPYTAYPGHYYRTKSKHFVTKSVHHSGELFYTVLQHFTPDYCTVHHIPLYFLTIG